MLLKNISYTIFAIVALMKQSQGQKPYGNFKVSDAEVLRRDLINEASEAPSSASNHDGSNHFYDGPFDFTFYRRDPSNVPDKLLVERIYGELNDQGIPSSIPISEFGMSPCSEVHQSLINKYIDITNVPDNVNQDGIFVCLRDEAMDGLINNTLTSIELPKLSRAYMSFHHICGNNPSTDGTTSRNCTLKFGLSNEDSSTETDPFYEILPQKKYNNGSLKLMSDMFYENVMLPRVHQGDKLRVLASFDAQHGGFGLDNVKFTTPQKCVPSWNRHVGFAVLADAEKKHIKVSNLGGTGLSQGDMDNKFYQTKEFTAVSVEQCARHCLLGSGCDIITLNQASKKCYIMPHNRLKNENNPNQVIQHSGSSDDHMYVLNCATPQENILRNNEAFTHTLSGWDTSDVTCSAGPYLYESSTPSTTKSVYNGWYLYSLQYICDTGEYAKLEQELNVLNTDELPYGIDKEYLETVKPSGLVRTWISITSSSPRTDVTHEFTLKVTLQDGSSLLDIGKEHFSIAESDLNKKLASTADPIRKEVAFAFSKLPGSNFTITQGADTISFVHKVLSGGSATTINMGPPEILLDMPHYMGCYFILDSYQTSHIVPYISSSLTPAKCITYCAKQNPSIRYAGLYQGNECFCLEDIPFDHMEYMRDAIEEEKCNVTCSGNSKYYCGGHNSVNIYVSECHGTLIRFEDNCYEVASSEIQDIISNVDECKNKGGELFIPKTSSEHHFVAQTFQSTNGMYHLGVVKYNKWLGILGVDNQHYIGTPYISLNFDLNNIQDIDLLTNESCLVYDREEDTWNNTSPCMNALGICRQKLVYGQGYQHLGTKISVRVHSSITNLEPLDWLTTENKTLPVHVQLEQDIYSGKQRHIEVEFPYQMIVSGLYIETLNNASLKKFTVEYAIQSLQFPNFPLKGISFDEAHLQVFSMGIGNFSTMPFVIARKIIFPDPVKTDRIRLNVVEGTTPVVLKMDVLGSQPDISYGTDPFLEKRIFINEIDTPGQQIDMRSYVGQDMCPYGYAEFTLNAPACDKNNEKLLDFELVLQEAMNEINKVVIEIYDNPFNIIIYGHNIYGYKISETHGSNYPISRWMPDEDLRLHVRCTEKALKISINDREVASWSNLHAGGTAPTLGFSNYKIGYTFYKQICGPFSWRDGCSGTTCNAEVTACSWQFESKYGYFGWLINQSVDNPHRKPNIHGKSNPDLDIKVPFQSGIIHLFVNDNMTDMSFYPVQARQYCHRNTHGSIGCNTLAAGYDSFTSDSNGYGGNAGKGSPGCPSNYASIGKMCIGWSVQSADSYDNMNSICKETFGNDSVPYSPRDTVHNAILRGFLSLRNETKIWIGIKKDNGNWMIADGRTLSDFESDWADGEPSEGQNKDCAYMEKDLNFRWKSALCKHGKPFYCSLAQPICPSGYNAISDFKHSCFKILDDEGTSVIDLSTQEKKTLYSDAKLNKMCKQEGTRLAVINTVKELEAIAKWALSKQQNANEYFLGIKYQKEKDTYSHANRYFGKSTDLITLSDAPYDMSSKDYGCVVLQTNPAELKNTPCASLQPDNANLIKYNGICQYMECRTKNNKKCQFPFRYKGRIYNTCTNLDVGGNGGSTPWCSTQTNVKGEHIEGYREECSNECAVSNCPIGFYWAAAEGTCYQLSAPIPSETFGSVQEAKDSCGYQGARLFQPRSSESIEYFRTSEKFHMEDNGLFPYAGSKGHIVIGLTYERKLQKIQMDSPKLYYNDGTSVSTGLLSHLLWEQDFPNDQDPNATCVVWSAGKIMNTKCNDEALGGSYYYAGNNDPGLFSGSPNYNDTSMFHRGFLCEARPIHTVSFNQLTAGALCVFPFRHNGNDYASCSHETPPSTMEPIIYQTIPWCATKVTLDSEPNFSSNVKDWGYCEDERNIIISGSGAGHFCPFPFLFNGQYHDHCTRNKIDGSTYGLEDEYWCPSPLNTTKMQGQFFDAAIFLSGGQTGVCSDFSVPIENGCNDHYDALGSEWCVRTSAYPEVYEDASKKCKSEGGHLLHVLSNSMNEELIVLINRRFATANRYQNMKNKKMWLGAEFSEIDGWKWRNHYQPFKEYTNWEAGADNPPFGCLSTGCNSDYGVVARPDAGMQWNADEKSNALPYICMSKCTQGYLWHQGIQKCLKVVHGTASDGIRHASLAAFRCSLNRSKLVSVSNCSQVSKLINDVRSYMPKSQNTSFWIGNFSPGKKYLDFSRNNWFEDGMVNSLGYGLPEMIVTGSSLCSLGDLDVIDSEKETMFNIRISASPNIVSDEINEWNHTNGNGDIGYICEQEDIWSCPEGFMMLQGLCYKRIHLRRTHAEARHICEKYARINNSSGDLASPQTYLQAKFIEFMFLEDDINTTISREELKTWLLFRKDQFSSSDVLPRPLAENIDDTAGYCFLMTRDLTSSSDTYKLEVSHCMDKHFFVCELDSVLNVRQKAYLPDPKALWSFSRNSLSQETDLFLDSSKTKIPSNNGVSSKNQVAFETLHTPVGLNGSTLFSQDPSSVKSNVILDYREHISGWLGMSLLFWIKIENRDFDQKYTIMSSIGNSSDSNTVPHWTLLLDTDGGITMEISENSTTEKFIIKSLRNPIALFKSRTWHFVAFIYDHNANSATFYIDSMFGYNNGGIDNQAKYVSFSGKEFLEHLNRSAIGIGNFHSGLLTRSFSVSISCLQLYNTALNEAEVHLKKECTDANKYKTKICPDGYSLIKNMCYKVSSPVFNENGDKTDSGKRTFAKSESECVMDADYWPYRKILFHSIDKSILDYMAELIPNETRDGAWIGIDDQNGDSTWSTSEGHNILVIAENTIESPTSQERCLFIGKDLEGNMTSSNCKEEKYYICATKPSTENIDNECPKRHYPYKSDCLLPSPQAKTFDGAKHICASNGGILLPIKDPGLLNFVQAWGPRTVRNSIWVGMEKKNVNRSFVEDAQQPLQEKLSDSLTYADGSVFDVENRDSYLGANILRGPCFALAANDGLAVRDFKCSRELGFICLWRGPYCPVGFKHLGQLSDGRTCFGDNMADNVTETSISSFVDSTCSLMSDRLRERWSPVSRNFIEKYRLDYPGGKWLSGISTSNVDWRHKGDRIQEGNALRDVLKSKFNPTEYKDMSYDGKWNDETYPQNSTGCLYLSSNGLYITKFNSNNSNECSGVYPTACTYKACMDTSGKKCVFPFKYKNSTDGEPLLFNTCSTLDLYKPWCPTVLSSDKNTIVEWGYCIPDCPAEEIRPVCQILPIFPLLADGEDGSVNFTINIDEKIIQGDRLITLGMDYVSFTCPDGYVFEDSQNITHYAFCFNTTFIYEFDVYKKCIPVKCPNPRKQQGHSLWFTNSVTGTWNYTFQEKDLDYLSGIQYTCPEGYVFDIYQNDAVFGNYSVVLGEEDFQNESRNFGHIDPEMASVTLTCASWGNWNPNKVPTCIPVNCTAAPVAIKKNGTDRGFYNWNHVSKHYQSSVLYECKIEGWGFPSTGLSEIINFCQQSKNWNLTNAEECILLPCPQQPPGPPAGGLQWYGIEFTRYSCPPGKTFHGSSFPFWYANCTVEKAWDPNILRVESCVDRSCHLKPPEPWLGMDVDWPKKSSTRGSRVTYTCPYKKMTYIETLQEQYSECIYEKDTNEMTWYPSIVDICSRTIPPCPTCIVLPPLPSYPLDYKTTATYYWSLIAENGFVTDSVTGFVDGKNIETKDVESIAGPFGFDEAIKLGEEQCVIKSEFQNQNDECIVNPKNCPDGLSFAIWEKATYAEDVLQIMSDHERKYIISTGADFNYTDSNLTQGVNYPGVSLYHDGMDLVAIVSTGDDVWKLQVRGQLENETWSNIGVVWKPNKFKADNNVEGGLTLYVMSEKVGHSVLPIPRPGGSWSKNQRKSIDASLISSGTANTHKIPFITIGCHADNGKLIDHIRPNTAFDELTIWNKALSTNRTVDEIQYFLGGYVPGFEVNPAEWNSMMDHIDLDDPSQREMAGFITGKFSMVKGSDQGDGENDGNSTQEYDAKIFPRTSKEQREYDRQTLKVSVSKKLVGLGGIKSPIRPKDARKTFKSLPVASGPLADTQSNIDGWKSIHLDPNEDNAMVFLNQMEAYVLEHMSAINISYDESYTTIYDHTRNEHQMHAPYTEESQISISAIKMYPWKSFQILGSNLSASNIDHKQPTNIVENPYWQQIDIKKYFSWAGSFAQFDIGDRNEIGKGDGVITKEEFSRVMDGWETCRRGVCKCQFDCRNRRDTIFSLASGVDEDLDKKITWNEFLRAVEAKRLTEKSVVMAQVREKADEFRKAALLKNDRWSSSRHSDVSLSVPSVFHFENRSLCENMPVTLLTAIYPGLGKIAPLERNPTSIRAPKFKLDSVGITVKLMVSLNPDYFHFEKNASTYATEDEFTESWIEKNYFEGSQMQTECRANMTKMKYKPIRLTFPHMDKQTALRKLLWHEDDLISNITQRRCVVWDPSIGVGGAWDAQFCTTVMVGSDSTTCDCYTFGTFSLIAEIVTKAEAKPDKTWLMVWKYIGYIVSLIVLPMFFGGIFLRKEMWDTFFLLRMHTGIGYFFGTVFMFITEINYIRDDRHINIAISALLQFSYLVAGLFFALESVAIFIAITQGITGGKTAGYTCIGYGCAFLNVGYTIFMHSNDYGSDPRAFIGWANETKQPFLYAMIGAGCISVCLCFVFLINLSFTQTRKCNVVEALAPKGQGLATTSFIFSLTWMFAYFAYWHEPDLERADSYPIFQLLNSWVGVFIFCFMGLGTKKFRNVFRCKEDQRDNKLKYLIGDLRQKDAEDIENRRDSLDSISSTSTNNNEPDSLDGESEEGSDSSSEEESTSENSDEEENSDETGDEGSDENDDKEDGSDDDDEEEDNDSSDE